MSIFGSIMSKIFGDKAPSAAQASMTPTLGGAAPAAAAGGATPVAAQQSAPGSTPAAGAPTVDVTAILDDLADKADQELNWKQSIVDLMKLLNLDSSLAARKSLAQELHYSGDMNDSAKMNVWLHKQVMTKLAQNGGNVPADLIH